MRTTKGTQNGLKSLVSRNYRLKPEERMKNVEERLKVFVKIPTETLRKRLGSDFLHGTNFFSLISSDSRITRRAEQFSSSPLPLFIGKWGRCLPPSSPKRAQLALASQVASSKSNRLLEEFSGRPKWAWLLFAPPFLLNTPPCSFLVILFP